MTKKNVATSGIGPSNSYQNASFAERKESAQLTSYTTEQLREALKLSEYDDPRPFWDKWKTHATLVVKNAAADHLKHMEGKSLPPDMVCTICETQGDPKCWACVQYGRAKGMTGERKEALDGLGNTMDGGFGGSINPERAAKFLDKHWHTIRTALEAKPEGEKDETCVLRKNVRRGFYTVTDTVICGQCIVEKYLRQGYSFDWAQTDKARQGGAK